MDAYKVSDRPAPVRGGVQPGPGDRNGVGTSEAQARLARNEAALATERWIHDVAFDHMDQGISVVDRDLRVVAFNQRFLILLDLPPDHFRAGDPPAAFFRYNAELWSPI